MRLCYHCMHQIQDEKVHTCPACGKPLKVRQENASEMLPPGTVLQGKFLIGYSIGFGGFGITYIGWDQVLQRKVAIKEFYPRQITERNEDGVTVTVTDSEMKGRFRAGLQSFLQEARSLASLQDTVKGVVSIASYFEANGTGYIVMEYLEGMDVKNILKKSGGKREYEWCRQVILTVLHTLRDVHRQGILHRDIAPDNVFITNEGVIKLIDFGAAKHTADLINTRSDIVLKVGYAPIEQYSKTAKQGPYTDLYAVAALFYRMLTGMKPAPANERVNEDTLVPPSALGVSIPEQAEMAIMVCLNIRPEHRLQSAGDFMEALDGTGFEPKYEPDWILPYQLMMETKQGKLAKMSAPVKGLILFAAILVVAGGIFAASRILTKKETIEVTQISSDVMMPDCVGKTSEEAVASLQEAGIPFNEKLTYEYNPSTEKGKVTAQSIQSGTNLQEGDVVNLTVSGGNSTFTMPDCSTMNREDAVNFFESKDIPVKTDESFSDDIPSGQLVVQTVAAGEDYTIGDSSELGITLIYSIGKKSDYDVKMPNLKNMSVKEAEKKLKDMALVLNIEKVKDTAHSSVKKGKISDQSIKAGETINTYSSRGSELILYTSIGPKPTPKPTKEPEKVQQAQPSTTMPHEADTSDNRFSGLNKKKKSGSRFSALN